MAKQHSITREMVHAGVITLEHWESLASREEIVAEVYKAMASVAPGRSRQHPQDRLHEQ
jgi:hypothetical protein